MADPLSIGWLYFILHAGTSLVLRSLTNQPDEAASELISAAGGNFYYDVLKKGGGKATELLVNRMKFEDTARQPTNRHLQRALRRAQLSATLLALQSCWEESKDEDHSFIERFMRPVKDRFFRTDKEKRLVEAREWLLESLHEVDKADYHPPQQADYDQIIMLADPLKAEPMPAELAAFTDELKKRTVDELTLWHPSMTVLADKINDGWDILIRDRDLSIATREAVHFDWFKLVYEYFSEEYKRGGEVAHALDRLLFYQIREDIRELPKKILIECFDEIGGSLLGYLKRMGDRQDEILREVRRRPFYAEWQGKYETEKVERCLFENSELLVGREEELASLDKLVANNPDGRGYYLIKAGAGFGKTSLLASWVRRRKFEGRFIAYHFFSQRHDTTDVNKGLRNLLRQLCIYYEIKDETLPPHEDSRDTIYGLIEKNKTRAGEPLVLVFDALDEADSAFLPPFPPLPEGIFVIVSLRADEKDTGSPYLNDWWEIKSGYTRTLTGVDRAAIKEWLEHERLRSAWCWSFNSDSTDSG